MKKIDQDKGSLLGAFDEHEPQIGHGARFMDKLDKEVGHSSHRNSQKWLRIAASLVIVLGCTAYFYFSNAEEVHPTTTAETKESIPIEEAERYYRQSFDQQFKAIANNYTDADSKSMIKDSEQLIQKLQKEYELLEKELRTTGDPRVATAMILNYKSRIGILEQLIQKLEYVTQLKNQTNEHQAS